MLAYLLMAAGFVLAAEGLLYALAPGMVERVLEIFRALPEAERRKAALMVAALGFLLLWAAAMLGA